MFKVFNRCLTSRTSGHDQTKINILQICHVVVNKVNVDYTSLLWWDFIRYVQKKKEVIQYPRFTKLIIADIMGKYGSVPKRLEEEYHVNKDDTPLVSVYTTRKVIVKGMPILDNLIADAIRDTQEYKDYVAKGKEKEIEEQLLKEDVEKIVESKDEESYASEFTDLVFLNEEDSGTRIESGSHKENPKIVVVVDDEKKKDYHKDDDDDDNGDHDDHALIRT
ncbi:hypothetical protein Tco_1143343 [Tanacetum coccineum]